MTCVGGDIGTTSSQGKSVPNEIEGIAEEKRVSTYSREREIDTDLKAIDTAFWRRMAGSETKV